MQRLGTNHALISKGLRPLPVLKREQHRRTNHALISKGLRRVLQRPAAFRHRYQPCPDLKGIKTVSAGLTPKLGRTNHALISKGLRRNGLPE